jgi:hypothetical protein
MPSAAPAIDHLVIAAPTLDAGVRWCEQTLGISPGAGGEHTLMGTHNRLTLIASPTFPQAYLEIIAINPKATPTKARTQARWFGFDEAAVHDRLQAHGPQLVHWVARVPNLADALAQCTGAGVDIGKPVPASRMTASGLLSWSIAIRPDGHLSHGAVMPTLISWGPQHPSATMASRGIHLKAFTCSHPQAATLNALWQALGGSSTCFVAGPVGLRALIETPQGEVCVGS